jgi:hypothetical protein
MNTAFPDAEVVTELTEPDILEPVHAKDRHVVVTAMALENGRPGARYNAVGEEGVALRDIAEVIGAGLELPTESITPEKAPEYFGGLTHLATNDFAASSLLTRQQLGWIPIGPSLLTDLRNMDYRSPVISPG